MCSELGRPSQSSRVILDLHSSLSTDPNSERIVSSNSLHFIFSEFTSYWLLAPRRHYAGNPVYRKSRAFAKMVCGDASIYSSLELLLVAEGCAANPAACAN